MKKLMAAVAGLSAAPFFFSVPAYAKDAPAAKAAAVLTPASDLKWSDVPGMTGMKEHKTSCEAGAECVLSIDARGKWDVVMEEAAKPAAKQ